MRILIFSEYYRPDGGPAAPLFTMLAESLVKLGYWVDVITTVPHYPSGRIPDDYKGWKVTRKVENGVNVIRVPLPSIDRKKLKSRLYQIISYQFFASFAGFKVEPDVVITHSPAFEVWLPSKLHGFKRNKKTIYSIHDVYPDVGIKMGIFKSEAVINVITAMEKNFLKKAGSIRVLSNSFVDRVHELGAEKEKINLIYDWVEIGYIQPMDKINAFSQEMNLTASFNVLYAGNMGHVQALDTVVGAAMLLKEYGHINFVFVGEGNAKQELTALVAKHDLTNVMFIPYQPREKMGQVLASANIGLVSLKKGTGFGALPSKTFSILASGRPLIACVDQGSDTWEVVERSGGGIPVPPEDSGLLSDAIVRIYQLNDQGAKMGSSGRRYVEKFHSPEFAARKFEELF